MKDPLSDWMEIRLQESLEFDEALNDQALDWPNADTFVEDLARLDECAEFMARAWPVHPGSTSSPGQNTTPTDVGVTHAPVSPANPSDARTSIPEAAPLQAGLMPGMVFGRFEIQGLLGIGGMGSVFHARDTILARDVALKVPHPGLLLNPDARERFALEAKAAGLLSHPHIIRVFDFGRIGNVDYLAMEYCQGPTLAEWLKSSASLASSPEQVRNAVQILLAVADGVQHAHDRGVIHRDLKPSNILMDASSSREKLPETPFPRITDFGLARLGAEEHGLTRTGALIGTAEFMAPEQVDDGRHDVGPASDQFSLGTILYLLLTGKSPFRREHYEQTLLAVQRNEPQPPSRLNCWVTRDLDSVCLKALHKEKSRRYARVGDMAEDLRNVLVNKPTFARPVSRREAVHRWIRRHPSWAISIAVVACSLLFAAVVSFRAAQRTGQLLDRTEDFLYVADVRLADEALRSSNASQAFQYLSRYLPSDESPHRQDRRTFPWHYLWSSLHKEEAVLSHDGDEKPSFIRFAANGRLVAATSRGCIHVWNVDQQRIEKTMQLHDTPVIAMGCEDDVCCTLDQSGHVAVWNLETGDVLRTRQLSQDAEYAVIVPRKRDIVWANREGILFVDSIEGEFERTVLGRHPGLRHIAVAADANNVITVGEQCSVYLWDLGGVVTRRDNGSPAEPVGSRFRLRLPSMEAPPGEPSTTAVTKLDHRSFGTEIERRRRLETAAFSTDGQMLAVGGNDGRIFVWKGEDQGGMQFMGHTSNIYQFAFSADGNYLVSGSKDSTVRIWDLDQGQLVAVLQGHTSRVYSVACDSSGARIASAGKDGTIRIWNQSSEAFTSTYRPDLLALTGQLLPDANQWIASSGSHTFYHSLSGETRSLPCLLGHQGSASVTAGRFVAVRGPGFFELPWSRSEHIPEAAGEPSHVSFVADLDGDGDDDQVTGFGVWPRLLWRENTNGTLGPPQLFRTFAGTRGINDYRKVQWTTDGTTSMVYCDRANATVAIASPPEVDGWHGQRFVPVQQPRCVWPRDMDGDQDLDLVIAEQSRVRWIETDAQRSFQTSHHLYDETQEVFSIQLADLNGDSWPELITLYENGLLAVRQGHPGEDRKLTFGPPADVTRGLSVPMLFMVCDCDRDGQQDLVGASYDRVVWWRSQGKGELAQQSRPLQEWDSTSNWITRLDPNVAVWDDEQQAFLCQIHALTDDVGDIAISPTNGLLATSDRSRQIVRVWDSATGRMVHQFPPVAATGSLLNLEFSQDGQLLLGAAGDHGFVWSIPSRKFLARLDGHDNTVVAIRSSMDSRFAVTTSHDYSVRVWDLKSFQQLHVFAGHQQRPAQATFSPDRKTLVSVGEQGEVILWDLVTGHQFLKLGQVHCEKVTDIGFLDALQLVLMGWNGQNHPQPGTVIGTWTAATR